ncbi:glycosyltransferase [Planobispora longispora]|uniref:Glycosyl transferase n=1 Tax=Planobispora longispora TaxID=28887 RepID=A0A8J3W6Y4_9ACTN|nr:glycosyltransferase [Planobispora longispora]GIH78048.1 glycosyl transferase [Planobispora longispora]
MSITVLMNAGPWLPVPPRGYGGIETVVATLVPELRARGVRVVLATVGASTLEADDRMHVFETGQFPHLQRPYNQVMGLAHAHLQRVVAELRRRRDIDLVHDHMEAVGLAVWGALGRSAPPVLHTLHWDLRKHPELYGGFDGGGRVWVNGVSASQLARAPRNLREHSLGWAHLATPLAAVVPASPATGTTAASPAATGHDRTGPMVILGRISPLKGQHLGARLCRELGIPLIMAGPVGGLDGPRELAEALADPGHPAHVNPDVRYHLEQVAPYIDHELVRWIGSVDGARRERLFGEARAALFPVQWEEPGGTAVVEALACGAPVIGLRRGCLPELVEHGRTGLLADGEEELGDNLKRAEEIDPEECRRSAARRFSPSAMADRYLDLYRRVLDLAARAR